MRLTLVAALTQRLHRLVNPDMHTHTRAQMHTRICTHTTSLGFLLHSVLARMGSLDSHRLRREREQHDFSSQLCEAMKVCKEAVRGMSPTWLWEQSPKTG